MAAMIARLTDGLSRRALGLLAALFAVVAAQAIQLPVALASSTVHAIEGRLDLRLALLAGLLMLAGSIAGQRAATRLDVLQLQRLVSMLLLAVGAWFAWLLLN